MNKVFGIGLSRTGTVSLTVALKILGYNIIHSPNQNIGRTLISFMNEWEGGTDSWVAFYYKKLDKAFPNSKFILTTRSLESWLNSYGYFLSWFRPFEGVEIVFQRYLYGDVKFNKETYTEAFIKHHKEVKEYFKDKPNDFLIMDFTKGDEWDKLCKFLNCRTPYYPFPHSNGRKI